MRWKVQVLLLTTMLSLCVRKCPEIPCGAIREAACPVMSRNVQKSRKSHYLSKISRKNPPTVGIVPKFVRTSFVISLTKLSEENRPINILERWLVL